MSRWGSVLIWILDTKLGKARAKGYCFRLRCSSNSLSFLSTSFSVSFHSCGKKYVIGFWPTLILIVFGGRLSRLTAGWRIAFILFLLRKSSSASAASSDLSPARIQLLTSATISTPSKKTLLPPEASTLINFHPATCKAAIMLPAASLGSSSGRVSRITCTPSERFKRVNIFFTIFGNTKEDTRREVSF